jgi:hypothetical protein
VQRLTDELAKETGVICRDCGTLVSGPEAGSHVHFVTCQKCGGVLASLRQQAEALRKLEPVEAEDSFNGAAMVDASNGRYVELDAVLQLLTPFPA